MEQAASPASAGRRRKPMRSVLAVGSSRASLNDVAQWLGSLGYLVILSESASQALELITARSFDLVLVDALAPETSSIHLLNEMRGSRDIADVPAIILSGAQDAAVEVAALAAGADDWLVKPVPPEILAARIERMLARAGRMDQLKRSNLLLDARIAERAMELGEARTELTAAQGDRLQLISSIRSLHDELDRVTNAG